MIYLLVGQPRHGKSQFASKLAHDIHEQNLKTQKLIDSGKADPEKHVIRKIYSDIDGHAENCEFVEKAPMIGVKHLIIQLSLWMKSI